jgi:hypothetical protein
MRSIIVTVSCSLALAACGGKGKPGSRTTTDEPVEVAEEHGGDQGDAHGEAHGEAHMDLPPEMAAFHDVLAPLWHVEGEKQPCPQAEELVARADAIRQAQVPAGVVEDDWHMHTLNLGSAADHLAFACRDEPGAVAAQLTTVHDEFHVLIEMIPHAEE